MLPDKTAKRKNATASPRYIFGLGVELFGVFLTPGTRLNGHLTRTMKLKTWPEMCSALLRTQLLSVENIFVRISEVLDINI